MALPSQIEVVQGTSPILTYRMTAFRDASFPGAGVDITGYEFQLVVKKVRGGAFEWFRVAGEIVDASDGTFQFILSPAHTDLPAGEWFGELRWWAPPTPPDDEPTDALAGAGAGNVENGLHTYKYSFVTPQGESELSPVSDGVTVADKTVNGKVSVATISAGPTGTTSRKLYRTVAGGAGNFKLLTTLADNTTTTYTDNTADGSLGADYDGGWTAPGAQERPRDAVTFPYRVVESNGLAQ